MKSNSRVSHLITLPLIVTFFAVGMIAPLDGLADSCTDRCDDIYEDCKDDAQYVYDSCMNNSFNDEGTCQWLYDLNMAICDMEHGTCLSNCL